jgi:predicted amidophosphoribosyltransferase
MGDFFIAEAPTFHDEGLCPDRGVEVTRKNKRCAVCAAKMRHRINKQVAQLLERKRQNEQHRKARSSTEGPNSG